MEKFIIQFDPDTDGEPNSYWDGTNPSTDLNTASLFNTLVTARQEAGRLQTQFTDREATVKKVILTVAFAPPPAPPA